MKYQLSERVLELLHELTNYRILSTEQVATFLYKSKSQKEFLEISNKNNQKNTANVLSRLATKKFVTRNYLYNSNVSTKLNRRPKSVWFITPDNLKRIRKELADTARADLWEVYFSDVNFDRRVSPAFQQNTLAHEVGISQCFLLMNAHAADKNIDLALWLNTSPQHPLIMSHVDVTFTTKKKTYTKKLPVNPDGFFILSDGNEYTFYFLEFDNNTETTTTKITDKFNAYYEYGKQKKIP